ncbi:hypothetical protein J8273_5239 [Carpediemonas membranifera]|uniref:Transmembrane protein n=1 Tax=Carpediemonas membranifera TaxID=201153 RepID=A0A8J6B1G5_9EUKA|nr:hypothetical protein J8273_5239 [Carpediemonas membranifera]|eukprot:KAG9392254.1 hypothetical protein J8273_5239 [Carpediemonas membranifera]
MRSLLLLLTIVLLCAESSFCQQPIELLARHSVVPAIISHRGPIIYQESIRFSSLSPLSPDIRSSAPNSISSIPATDEESCAPGFYTSDLVCERCPDLKMTSADGSGCVSIGLVCFGQGVIALNQTLFPNPPDLVTVDGADVSSFSVVTDDGVFVVPVGPSENNTIPAAEYRIEMLFEDQDRSVVTWYTVTNPTAVSFSLGVAGSTLTGRSKGVLCPQSIFVRDTDLDIPISQVDVERSGSGVSYSCSFAHTLDRGLMQSLKPYFAIDGSSGRLICIAFSHATFESTDQIHLLIDDEEQALALVGGKACATVNETLTEVLKHSTVEAFLGDMLLTTTADNTSPGSDLVPTVVLAVIVPVVLLGFAVVLFVLFISVAIASLAFVAVHQHVKGGGSVPYPRTLRKLAMARLWQRPWSSLDTPRPAHLRRNADARKPRARRDPPPRRCDHYPRPASQPLPETIPINLVDRESITARTPGPRDSNSLPLPTMDTVFAGLAALPAPRLPKKPHVTDPSGLIPFSR